jgi:hypothetical protein
MLVFLGDGKQSYIYVQTRARQEQYNKDSVTEHGIYIVYLRQMEFSKTLRKVWMEHAMVTQACLDSLCLCEYDVITF